MTYHQHVSQVLFAALALLVLGCAFAFTLSPRSSAVAACIDRHPLNADVACLGGVDPTEERR